MATYSQNNESIFGIMYWEDEVTEPSTLWYSTNEDRNILFAQLRMAGEITVQYYEGAEVVTGTIRPVAFCRLDKDTDLYLVEKRKQNV